MNALVFSLRIALYLLIGFARALGDPTVISENQNFPSPNGTFVAHLHHSEDGWYHMSIKNTKTGLVDESQKVYLTPLFAITWTGDSRTIIAVGHVAHGSLATLFHLTAAGWNSHVVYPPDLPPSNYRISENVVGLTAKKRNVLLSYVVRVENRVGGEVIRSDAYKVYFEINPETEQVDHVKKDYNYMMLPGAEDWNGTIPKASL